MSYIHLLLNTFGAVNTFEELFFIKHDELSINSHSLPISEHIYENEEWLGTTATITTYICEQTASVMA